LLFFLLFLNWFLTNNIRISNW